MITAGQLDRQVTILTRSDTTDADYGTKEATWPALATVWARVTEVAPSQAGRLVEQISIMRRPVIVLMRWRDDVTAANRLRIDGVEMKIAAPPAMVGRRQWLEIMAEALSSEGQEP